MPRSTTQVNAELSEIRATLAGLRTGFSGAQTIIENKLGVPTAKVLNLVVGQLLDMQDTIALTLAELNDRVVQIEKEQTLIADGVASTLRALQ